MKKSSGSKDKKNVDYVEAFFNWFRQRKFFAAIIVIGIILGAILAIPGAVNNFKENFKKLLNGDTTKPDTTRKHPVPEYSFSFNSGDPDFNLLVQNKMREEGYLMKPANAACPIVMKVYRREGIPVDLPGMDYGHYFLEAKIIINICDNRDVPIGISCPGTRDRPLKDTAIARDTFDRRYSVFINKYFDSIYNAIKANLPKKEMHN